jgi:hypothetical protein
MQPCCPHVGMGWSNAGERGLARVYGEPLFENPQLQ